MQSVDDSYLLVGSNHVATAPGEFTHSTIWARESNVRLNPSKTRELFVYKSRHVLSPASPIVSGPERINPFHSGSFHSGYFYSASSSPLLLRVTLGTAARILCRNFTPKRHRQL